MPNYPTCGHRGKCLNCSLLTMVDIKEFHAAFYTVRTKMSQDAFILKYCSVSTPVRYRPRSGDRDVCSTCLELSETIKREKEEVKLGSLKTQLTLHKTVAKAFFTLLKQQDPVVSGTSCGKNALDKNKVSIYTWTENEMRKSSNEVASAVFHELDSKLTEGEFDSVHTIRLVADGCGGQNKNSHGTVKKLGEHWENFDWKTQIKEYIKDTKDLHFKISRIRRLVLTKHRKPKCIKVQGEMTYLHDTAQALKVNKPGKNLSTINPVQFKIGVKVQSAKLKDVQKLLQNQYGNQWHEIGSLQWYKDIIDKNDGLPEKPHEFQNECECMVNNEHEEELIEIVNDGSADFNRPT
ncbi:hypothetical protein J6590_041576 [Homalodisca vitripennis]|nr:hypothetical protein J6590_041576 [Homalodisca vitripennis]